MLLAAALLLVLAGCKKQDPSFVPLAVTPGETYTGYEGVEIRIDSLTWLEGNRQAALTVAWQNKTQYEVTYGEAYVIERLDGGEWVSCAIPEDPVFNLLAYLLPAGGTTKESYTLTDMFDISSPGTYRFKTDCYVPDGPGQSTKCELVAEFAIGNVKCPDDSKETGNEVQWCAQYIRTDGSSGAVQFPGIRIIRSLQELKDYYNIWREVFYLERKDNMHADTANGFSDACDQYDEEFFEKNYLIFVLMEEGSGSISHEVRNVQQTTDKKISISIDRKVPEAGTCDMAQWHIILELSRDVLLENTSDTVLYIDGQISYMDGAAVIPQTEGALKKPPKGSVFTPEGEADLHTGGYSWFCQMGNGIEQATIADQAARPLSKESLRPVTVGSQYAETVYAPVPGSGTYGPTNSQGYLLKLNWEVCPASVTYTCWPDDVWQKGGMPEENVVSYQDFAFYAKPGGYIYEIVATWDDTGAGYHGTANYYIYIIGGNEVS